MSTPDTVPTWPRIEAVAREDGTGEVIVDGNAQHVAAGNLEQVRVEIIRAVTNVAISFGRPVRVSTSGPDGYWPLIVYPNGAVADDEDQPRPGRRAAVDDLASGDGNQAPAVVSEVNGPESPAPEQTVAVDDHGDDHSEAAPPPGDDHGEPDHQPDAAVAPAVDVPSAPLDAPSAPPSAPSEPYQPATGSESHVPPSTEGRPEWERPEWEQNESDAAPTYPQQPGYVALTPQPSTDQQPQQPVAQPSFPPPTLQPPVQQPPVQQPPAQQPPGQQPPAAPEEPDSGHEPAHGTGASSPWPDRAQPGAGRVPGAFGRGGQPGIGQAPPGQPPATFGRAPAGQSPMPQVDQPPADRRMGEPAARQSTARPQPARWSGQSAAQHSAVPQRSAEAADQPLPQQRQSFLTREQIEEPASRGFRGMLGRVGIKMAPNETERSERADVAAVSQHWPGPRTIAIVNAKGGAGKTPTTILLSAVFALFGGAGVIAWDNNQTRGTLGWRTEQGQHESTLLDLLPQIPRLLGTGAQSADLAHFVHHQTRDRFDVLRSKPMVLAHMQRLEPNDVDAIHAVLGKYYRLIFIDSGNDESDPMWLRMVDHSDQLVVATSTRDDHAEAGALLLEALAERDERSAALARSSVAIVSQADPSARPADVARVAAGYQALTRATVTIPFDPAMVDGLLHYGALKPETKRAWLGAAAAVARGL